MGGCTWNGIQVRSVVTGMDIPVQSWINMTSECAMNQEFWRTKWLPRAVLSLEVTRKKVDEKQILKIVSTLISVASNTIDTISLFPSIFRYCFNCFPIYWFLFPNGPHGFSLFIIFLQSFPIHVSIYISNDPFITSTIFNVALFNFPRHLPSSHDTSNLTSCRPISSQCSLQYIEKKWMSLKRGNILFYKRCWSHVCDIWYFRIFYL